MSRVDNTSMNEELLKWIKEKIKEKRFASVTHAIQYALEKIRREQP